MDIGYVTCELCRMVEGIELPHTSNIRDRGLHTFADKPKPLTADSLRRIPESIRDIITKKGNTMKKKTAAIAAEPIPCGYHMYEEDVLPPELRTHSYDQLEHYYVICLHCGLTSPLQSTPELALSVWEQLSLAINLGIDEETIDAIEIVDSTPLSSPVLKKSKSASNSDDSGNGDSAPRKRGRKSNISDEELDDAYEILKDYEPDGEGKSDILEETEVDARLWQKVTARLIADGVWRSEGQKRGTKYYDSQ